MLEYNSKSDSTELSDDDSFLRRIPPWHLNGDEISSAAFQNDDDTPDRMSANLLRLSSVEHTLSLLAPEQNPENWGVASISYEVCNCLSQVPEYSPVEGNVAHCDIIGEKTRSVRKQLRNKSKYLKYPRKPI